MIPGMERTAGPLWAMVFGFGLLAVIAAVLVVLVDWLLQAIVAALLFMLGGALMGLGWRMRAAYRRMDSFRQAFYVQDVRDVDDES